MITGIMTKHSDKTFPTVGPLLVVGTAAGVWEDLDRWVSISGPAPYSVMALSDMGAYYPGVIDHWASLHPKLCFAVKTLRAARRWNLDFVSHTIGGQEGDRDVDVTWQISKLCGSSAMFASLIGTGLGYKRVILAGCPLDSSIKQCWTMMKKEIPMDAVRSMSGWSRELLGFPSPEWLNGN